MEKIRTTMEDKKSLQKDHQTRVYMSEIKNRMADMLELENAVREIRDIDFDAGGFTKNVIPTK